MFDLNGMITNAVQSPRPYLKLVFLLFPPATFNFILFGYFLNLSPHKHLRLGILLSLARSAIIASDTIP